MNHCVRSLAGNRYVFCKLRPRLYYAAPLPLKQQCCSLLAAKRVAKLKVNKPITARLTIEQQASHKKQTILQQTITTLNEYSKCDVMSGLFY